MFRVHVEARSGAIQLADACKIPPFVVPQTFSNAVAEGPRKRRRTKAPEAEPGFIQEDKGERLDDVGGLNLGDQWNDNAIEGDAFAMDIDMGGNRMSCRTTQRDGDLTADFMQPK